MAAPMIPALSCKIDHDDARVKLVPNAGRVGPAGARNTGIRAAQAEMVAFLDSDDNWDPEKLEAFFIDFPAPS